MCFILIQTSGPFGFVLFIFSKNCRGGKISSSPLGGDARHLIWDLWHRKPVPGEPCPMFSDISKTGKEGLGRFPMVKALVLFIDPLY